MSSYKNWKIDDPLFYPLGIFNNTSKNKTVFVIWSFDCILTYIFKKTDGSSVLTDTYKILFNGTIKDIVVTEYNTIALTDTGLVYYFASSKSLKRLKFLKGIKCICRKTNGFVLIKIDDDKNSIYLETYKDFDNSTEAEKSRNSYDISFDNIIALNSSFNNEKFSISSIKITDKNKEFLEVVTNKSINNDEIYLFSISNNLFCLYPEDMENGYEIFLIFTLPSEIEAIKFASSINALLIFFNCGAIEIISYFKIFKHIQRSTHITGSDWVTFSFDNDCCFYSDGTKVTKVEFSCDQNDIVTANEIDNRIPGIIALTWVNSIQTLVCLSDNNIFYKIKFQKFCKNTVQPPAYIVLNDSKLKEIESEINVMIDLIDEPKNIKLQIEKECLKQEIMTVTKLKRSYANLVTAKVSYHNCIPNLNGATLYPDSDIIVTNQTYFAVITFTITWSNIFKNSLWKLIIELNTGNTTFYKSIKICENIIKQDFNILLQIQKTKTLIIPQIVADLSAYVNVGNEFLYVIIPIEMKSEDYQKLFTTTTSIKIGQQISKEEELDKILLNLAERNNPLDYIDKQSKIFILKYTTPMIMAFEDILNAFEIVNTGEIKPYKITLHFLGEQVDLNYNENENFIEIKTNNPGVLCYTKHVLMKHLSSEYYDIECVDIRNAFTLYTKSQCELEARYGGDDIELKTYANSLSRIYHQLRETVKDF